ncbi:efflux RND transporter permease subunit [Spirulina subsalsa]|uniref:efflux RND transporter permease subunit n=1 Tax=Spirulina subsalsa TaxID=54311 RepID=UPI0003037744|nr:efflux RND transporter permease subunit [Spirulina subsalsa]
MSFHVSSWSIKNPVPTVVMFLTLGIVGFFSFLGLGIDQQPNIDIPTIQVSVTQPGAGPVELETQVTRKVEDAIAGLADVDDIISNISEGISNTTVQFTLGVDSNQATNDVRNAIAQIRSDLPQDINEPIVQRLEFAGGAIMTYTLSSNQRSVEELSNFIDQDISRALSSVPGIAQIERIGGVDREVRVNLQSKRLQAYGITATAVNDQIRSLNLDLPGGRSEVGGSEQNIRTLGSAQTIAQLQQYPIVLPDGSTVPLGSLGSVEDGSSDPRQMALLNGESVVTFSIRRSTGSTLVTVEEQTRKAIAQLEKTLPSDLRIDLIFTRATAIRDSYKSTMDAVIIGSILTVITVGLFLRDWRMTLITALALPLSIIPTFAVMGMLNYTLNGMTLLALALAMGNLVDDAICMIENIDQHLQMGKTPLRAAWDGAREIGLAVITTTATIVAVFLPVAFMGGIPGQFFQPFGVTVAVATMFSTLVATTMTPMLSAYLLNPKTNPSKFVKTPPQDRDTLHLQEWREELQEAYSPAPRRKRQPYRGALTWALRHRIATLLMAIAFFIGSLQLIPYIPQGLFDSGDIGLSTVNVNLPPGSTLSDTETVLREVDQVLRDHPAVANVLASASAPDSASVFVNLVPRSERIHQRDFEQEMRSVFQTIPGARISFQSGGAGGSSKDLSLILKSQNPDSLADVADRLENEMRQLPGLVEVSSSASLVRPELVIQPNLQRAADLGVSVQAIARTASLALIGDNESNLAKFNLPDRQIPIRVQIDPIERQNIDTIRNLQVPTNGGRLVPLSSVATIRLGSGPAEIQRYDRYRQVSLEANLEGIALGNAVQAVRALPTMTSLPPDVFEEPSGDAEIMRDIFARFASALGLAILSIYVILVLLYNNFLYPFAILAALPLSIGGALLGLLVMQKELGLFALIGIVLLMGLVTKNAILLVDCTLANMAEGSTRRQAIIDAGVSRLRPIIMTSISTVAGMLPIALEFGADGEVRSPMAIAVIGGFSTSTLLTLIVVPVLFTYVDSVVKGIGKLFRRENAPQEEYLEINH